MNESKDLKRIQDFVDRLKSTNSTNDKIDIIKEYEEDYIIEKTLKYTYSPFKQFHLTSATVKKNKKLEPREGYNDLFYLLDALTKRTITGHDAIQYVKGYVQYMEEWQQDLVFCILDKNLKTRTGADLINKAIPGCVPTFKVALANSYDKQKGKVNFNTQKWFASHKLDGVRCLAIIDENGNCNFFSRQGKTFDTLDVLKNEIESLDLCNMVLDGEVCIVDENGAEDFQGIMKEIKRKDHTIQNPKYKVFDYLMSDEFDNQKSKRTLSDRLGKFNMIYNAFNEQLNCIDPLEQWKVESEEHFQELAELATKNNWEEMLSNVVIEHKGCDVGVGSGFDQGERRKYFNKPELIIGKTITVQYFEETLNQNGCHSLRFPVVKHVYENGRTI